MSDPAFFYVDPTYLAEKDETCHVCSTLGIPTPTIIAGQEYIVFTFARDTVACCTDCYARIFEECLPREEDESE